MEGKSLLLENAYIEAKEYLAFNLDRGQKVFDADLPAVKDQFGIDLAAGAVEYVKHYDGTVRFVIDLQGQLIRKGSLTVPQLRAALNILKDEIDKGKIEVVRRTGELDTPIAVTEVQAQGAQAAPVWVPDNTDPRLFECYTCGEHVRGYANLVHHRDTAHLKAVMDETKAEKSFLDIRDLPDGRYAAVSPKDDTQFIYLTVKTLKRGSRRDRRFRYGKVVSGREYVPAGTIEVREWAGDTKRLCGMQRPGEGYEGEFIDQLVEIMMAPKVWAIMFAKFIGVCSICGKTLTDDDPHNRAASSREAGIGPECEKKWGRDYWKRWQRPVAEIGGLVKK
jgi:hypothetical protein